MEQFKDYYQILGVDADASAHAIREAYNEKIQEVDPERGGYQEVYDDIQEAFDVLSDPEERQSYDEAYVHVNEDWGFSDDEHQSQEDETPDDDPVMHDETDWRNQRQQKPKPLFPEWSGWKKVGIASLVLNLLIVILFAMGITEVSDAQQEVQNVRTQEEERVNRIDDLEEENRELEEELEQFTSEVVRLEEELTIMAEEISSLETENDVLLDEINNLEEDLAAAEEEAESVADNDTDNGTGETFGRGASIDDIQDILGSPDEINDPYHRYGRSTITIEDGNVTGWSDVDGSLPVQITGAANVDTFSEGSSEEEVAGAMGAPNALRGETWTYGQSTVTFSDGVVSSFDNSGGNLALEE
ncbi:J domain-containing protein [Salisediminibacterium beveridgei]|uniref:DnaJ-class molecular chaperone n=1 Tax=Salisediminibacterium beveridgei TaxID=632773 RepID=A0A1D7QU79_9BACI|nr:J domain-containing protein [Salisediminibacterium beveridgei]AOM82535.1 DnaJ-class molecular chaperone [Salisediminibacterium beveridgei]